MHKSMNLNEQDDAELISALADGELRGAELDMALGALKVSPEAQAQWHAYHLVGDVLRSNADAPIGAFDESFMKRLRHGLQEPVSPMAARVDEPPLQMPMRPSANDALWRWKLIAGVSVLGVALTLGWQLMGDRSAVDGAVQLAQQSRPAVMAQPQLEQEPVMIRDPRIDQLLAAHQQFGGTSALQMPAGFLRNATFERPAP